MKNNKYSLFNSREVTEFSRILDGDDNDSKVLILEILANTNKRFNARDATHMVNNIRRGTTRLVTIVKSVSGVSYQHIMYTFSPYDEVDVREYPDKAYVFDLIQKVIIIHKYGFGKTAQDKNRYKKREYGRNAKNHYS